MDPPPFCSSLWLNQNVAFLIGYLNKNRAAFCSGSSHPTSELCKRVAIFLSSLRVLAEIARFLPQHVRK